MQLRCAGKVFIAGEYACLEGGPSLLGTVGPLFSLTVSREAGQHPMPFAELSPAGLYLTAQLHELEGVRMTWADPYDTPIGVGSSSAQFILSVAAVAKLRGETLPSVEELLELYWKTVGDSQGLRPSGADIMAQWLGGPVVVRNKPVTSHRLNPWKSDAVFLLAYTGRKAKTHEHLLKLRQRGFPKDFKAVLGHLNEITVGAVEAWEQGNAKLLGSALNAFQSHLARGGLAPEDFTAELEHIQAWPGVLGCKGAGAQGGDCVLLLVESKSVALVVSEIQRLGWNPIHPSWTHEGLTLSKD